MWTIMVTGHRPNKLGGYYYNPTQDFVRGALRAALQRAQAKHPDIHAISGMALGVDQWFAQEALTLNIPVLAYIPFKGQDRKWPPESQQIYQKLLKNCKTTRICNEGAYSPQAMQIRNECMVNDANAHIAVWDGTPGGTGNCVQYIRKLNFIFLHINPTNKTITWSK